MYRAIRLILVTAIGLFSLLWAPLSATAAEIEISNPQVQAVDDGIALSADFALDFNGRLEEAVNKGVVLYFVIDFEVARARWYWFDEKLLTRTQTWRLSYHALTRQYRLSTGALYQNYTTLDEALRAISRLRNWQVIEKGEVKPGQMYVAALRLQLDLSQMPKTFQVGALANKDWVLTSDWQRWTFAPAEVGAGGSGDGK